MNQVVLIGRLTKDPEIRYAQNGNAQCIFTLAVDRGLSREKKEEMTAEGKPTADFIRIIVWGKSAENCSKYLSKGSQCAVNGKIVTGSYEASDGTRRYTTDVNANFVEFLRGTENAAEMLQEDFPF